MLASFYNIPRLPKNVSFIHKPLDPQVVGLPCGKIDFGRARPDAAANAQAINKNTLLAAMGG
jgi:hypothetical protein